MSEMVKVAGEAGVDMITDLVNPLIVDGVIPREWELRTIVNYYKGKGNYLERGNCRGLELAVQIPKRVVAKLTRQHVDIDEIQPGFMPGCKTTNAIFILRQLHDKYLEKKILYFALNDLEKAFNRVPRALIWWALRKLGVEKGLVKII